MRFKFQIVLNLYFQKVDIILKYRKISPFIDLLN